MTAKAAALFQPHRVEPEFGLMAFALDMNESRLIPISRVKEKSVWPNSKNGWHTLLI